MGVSSKAEAAYKRYKTAKKAYDYYKLAKGALDEDTRSGSLFKLGIKVTTDVASKVLGASISKHPYFTYHKAHFEALAMALDASAGKELANRAFNRAVEAADATADVTAALNTFTHRRNALSFEWSFTLAEAINIRGRYRKNPTAAAAEVRDMGLTPATLDSYIDKTLYEWRARWAELASDAMELYVMIDAEARIAEEAMTRYNAKVKKLTEGSSAMGRIAGYAAEQDRQWQIYERMTETPKSNRPEQAVQDPALFARKQRDKVDAVAGRVAQACDIVMSDAVETPDTLLRKLDAALNMPPM